MYTNCNTPILNVKKNIFNIIKDKNLIAHWAFIIHVLLLSDGKAPTGDKQVRFDNKQAPWSQAPPIAGHIFAVSADDRNPCVCPTWGGWPALLLPQVLESPCLPQLAGPGCKVKGGSGSPNFGPGVVILSLIFASLPCPGIEMRCFQEAAIGGAHDDDGEGKVVGATVDQPKLVGWWRSEGGGASALLPGFTFSWARLSAGVGRSCCHKI